MDEEKIEYEEGVRGLSQESMNQIREFQGLSNHFDSKKEFEDLSSGKISERLMRFVSCYNL